MHAVEHENENELWTSIGKSTEAVLAVVLVRSAGGWFWVMYQAAMKLVETRVIPQPWSQLQSQS